MGIPDNTVDRPAVAWAGSGGHRSRPRWGRGIWALFFLNAATAVSAVLTARTLKANYDFLTPLLRVSASLIDRRWS